MMKAVSLAVDLIMAHFNSRQDPEEKVVTRSQFFLSKKKKLLQQKCQILPMGPD